MSSMSPDGRDEDLDRAGRWLPRVAVTTALAAYGLIILGSQVRVSGSGMGCPDWPLCDGRVGPIPEFHALMEQLHRYVAGTVTILVLATAALALRARPRSSAVRPALVAVGIIGVQITLGAVTVFAGNAAPTVVAHLLAGLSLLSCATITATCSLAARRESSGPRLAPLGWTAVAGAGVLLFTGSLIVNAGAAQACAGFPLCPSDQPGSLVVFHLLHRTVALLVGSALVLFAVHAWSRWTHVPAARTLALALGVLVMATATWGLTSALLQAPPGMQNMHLAGAAAVLVVAVALATVGWLAGADDLRTRATLPGPAEPRQFSHPEAQHSGT